MLKFKAKAPTVLQVCFPRVCHSGGHHVLPFRITPSHIEIKNLTLRKLSDCTQTPPLYSYGQEVFLVTRKGEVLSGFTVEKVLCDMVSLSRAPLPDSDKQGFTVDGELLRPNWCAGRKAIIAGCRTREEAEALASRRVSR